MHRYVGQETCKKSCPKEDEKEPKVGRMSHASASLEKRKDASKKEKKERKQCFLACLRTVFHCGNAASELGFTRFSKQSILFSFFCRVYRSNCIHVSRDVYRAIRIGESRIRQTDRKEEGEKKKIVITRQRLLPRFYTHSRSPAKEVLETRYNAKGRSPESDKKRRHWSHHAYFASFRGQT